MADDISISEESTYQDKTPSLKEICLRHVSKISTICCQEFTGGYWQEKPMKIGGGMVVTKTYHPDVREAYCNAIDFLFDLVMPFADDRFKAYVKLLGEDNIDVKEKLKQKRKLFQEMNIMFERINFFAGTESYDE